MRRGGLVFLLAFGEGHGRDAARLDHHQCNEGRHPRDQEDEKTQRDGHRIVGIRKVSLDRMIFFKERLAPNDIIKGHRVWSVPE